MSNSNEPRDLLDELETLQRVLDDAASDQVDHAKAVPAIEPANDIDDIPLLDEVLSSDEAETTEPPVLRAEAGVLKAVPSPQQEPAIQQNPLDALLDEPAAAVYEPHQIADLIGETMPEQTTPGQTSHKAKTTDSDGAFANHNTVGGNPFLPQSILDKLAHEREAAQFNAEQAQQTMAKIMESQAQDNTTLSNASQLAWHHIDTPNKTGLSQTEKAKMIDELVKEMLPEIEARLRKALHEKL